MSADRISGATRVTLRMDLPKRSVDPPSAATATIDYVATERLTATGMRTVVIEPAAAAASSVSIASRPSLFFKQGTRQLEALMFVRARIKSL
jgi:hypothetical protein